MKKPSNNTVKTAQSQPSLQSEIRKHYYLDEYVIIAPHRSQRPHAGTHVTDPSDPETCPFCRPPQRSTIWQSRNKQVCVIPNAFPALELANPDAYGSQELIIETTSHDQRFSELTVPQIQHIFDAYHQRLLALKKVPNIRYVLVFKNQGIRAGATEPHAHSQVLALPLVPPMIQREADALNHYRDRLGSCALCDVIAWETKHAVRVVDQDRHFVVISPYAANHGYELWFIPRSHKPSFTELSHDERSSLALFMKNMTAKLDNADIDFNYFLQEFDEQQNHHFVVKIEPRTATYAGAELGTGVIINAVSPELAANWYKKRPST